MGEIGEGEVRGRGKGIGRSGNEKGDGILVSEIRGSQLVRWFQSLTLMCVC